MIPTRRHAAPAAAVLLLAAACATDPTGPSAGTDRPGLDPALAAALPGVCNADLSETALTSTGWAKVWTEDFLGEYPKGGSAVGLSQWNLWTGGAWNDELQLYQGDGNLSLSGGILSIAAEKETVTGATSPFDPTPKTFGFTSGRIESKALFGAGPATPRVRFAARITLPSGYGMWPAFWSYGDPWPTQGEIDVLEARGNIDNQFQTAFYYGKRAGTNQVRNSAVVITTTPDLDTCWHVYEVEWTKTALTFYLDGQVVDVKTSRNVADLYGKLEKLTLNLAVGGVFFRGIDPATVETGTMQVDWVKVFTAR